MGPLLPLAALALFLVAQSKRGNAPAGAPPGASAAPATPRPAAVPVQSVPAASKPRPQRPAAASAAAPRPATSGAKPAAGPVIDVDVPYTSKPAAAKQPSKDELLQAAMLAEKQTVKPQPQQTVSVMPAADSSGSVAQVAPAGHDSMPAGYDRAAASARAQPMADHIRTRKSKYDRAVLATFQKYAGLKDDGLYGPQSAAALRYFGAANVPAPLFKGSVKTYAPPGG